MKNEIKLLSSSIEVTPVKSSIEQETTVRRSMIIDKIEELKKKYQLKMNNLDDDSNNEEKTITLSQKIPNSSLIGKSLIKTEENVSIRNNSTKYEEKKNSTYEKYTDFPPSFNYS